jgi:hypothetical protein
LLRELLQHLTDVRKCRTVSLHVKTDNYLAIRLYQRVGFVTKEFLPRHYYFDNARHDAYLLELDCDAVDLDAAASRATAAKSASRSEPQDSAFHNSALTASSSQGYCVIL